MNGLIKILVLDNEVEAQIFEDLLSENEIPHIMKTYHDAAYDGLFQMSKGWGHVEAPAEYKDKIISLYQELTNNDTLSD